MVKTEDTSMKNIDNLFQLVIDNIPARIFWKDSDCVYLGANRLFVEDAGLNSVDELIGKSDHELVWVDQAQAFIDDDNEVLTSGQPKLHIEEPQYQADGTIHWLETSKIPLFNNNDLVGVLGIYRDITDEKNQQLLVEKMALQDALTEIPNRHFIEKHIKHTTQAVNTPSYSSLLFIDLDYFKTVNDTWGHHVGDLLLKQVANKLKDTVGYRGTLARIGGDEFSVLVNHHNNEEQLKLDSELLSKDIIQNFTQPFVVGEHVLYLGASIGISLYKIGEANCSTLFREADLAMYQAKLMGRNAYVFYSQQMKVSADVENELLMKLRQAVDQNEFHLLYQPLFDVNEQCIGAEALMRWQQPEIGLISPDDFIPVAEKAGLIHAMGEWLLDESRQLQQRRQNAGHQQRLSINISPIQFRQEGFEALLVTQLLSSGLPASMFEIEVTESLLLSNQEVAFDKLRKLREIGFSIAIDDFGTGYSSLSYLSRLPVDKLKIDRSFVMRLFDDEKNQIIVKMILQMASSLGIKTVAEGVETKEEFEFLKAHQCDYFQGYYFSKPISADEYCTKW